jgi:hypothetical protein
MVWRSCRKYALLLVKHIYHIKLVLKMCGEMTDSIFKQNYSNNFRSFCLGIHMVRDLKYENYTYENL